MKKRTNKEWAEFAGIILGTVATLVAVLAYFQSREAHAEARRISQVGRQSEARELLYEAWDLMAGEEGARVVHWPADAGEESARSLELARRKIEQAEELDPAEEYLRNIAGCSYDFLHYDFSTAIEKYEKTIASNPESPQAFYNLASVLVVSERHNEALDAYGAALVLAPAVGATGSNEQLIRLPAGLLLRLETRAQESVVKTSESEKSKQRLDHIQAIIRNTYGEH